MFTSWKVLSAKDCIRYCTKENKEDAVIISINNSFEIGINLPKDPKNGVKDVLRLFFDDVLKKDLYKESKIIWVDKLGRCYTPFDESDCKKIHDFVMRYYKSPKPYCLIVHCGAGISRSAAVLAATWKYLFNDDSIIYNNPFYHPNGDVYRMLLNYYYENEGLDKMNVVGDDLRFGVNKSPWGYDPHFDYSDLYESVYVPSVEMVNLLPDLVNLKVKRKMPFIKNSDMPFFRFPFAVTEENTVTHKMKFQSTLEVDAEVEKHEDTIAFKLLRKLNETKYFPNVFVHTEAYNTTEGSFVEKRYDIVLFSQHSRYFWQKNFNFDTKFSPASTFMYEVEFNFPDGYKSWSYFFSISSDVMGKEEVIKNITFFDFFYTQENEKTGETIYIIRAQRPDGKEANIEFTQEEWDNKVLYNRITGVRLVSFK